MNKLRRAVSLALSSVMVFSMSVPAYADPVDELPTSGSVPAHDGFRRYDFDKPMTASQFNWDYSDTDNILSVRFGNQATADPNADTGDFDYWNYGYGLAMRPKLSFAYIGDEMIPYMIFAPSNNPDGWYDMTFDQSMRGTIDIYNTGYVSFMHFNNTGYLTVNLKDFWENDLPPVEASEPGKVHLSFPNYLTYNAVVPATYEGFSYSIKSDCLETATLSEGLTKVPNGAFENNPKLIEVNLPDTVTSIEYGAFQNDENLKSIAIPSSVKTVKPDAFKGSGVTDIYYDGTISDWEKVEVGYYYKVGSDNYCITYPGFDIDHEICVHCTDNAIRIYQARNPQDFVWEETSGYCYNPYQGAEGFMWKLEGDKMSVVVGPNDENLPGWTSKAFTTALLKAKTLTISSSLPVTKPEDVSIGLDEYSNDSMAKTEVSNPIDIVIEDSFNGTFDLQGLTNVNSISVGSGKYVSLKLYGVSGGVFPEIVSRKAEFLNIYLGKCDKTEVTVPKCYDNVQFSFNGNADLEKATYENGTKTIRTPGISGSKVLSEINLPDTVETIEYLAFSGSETLQSIKLPSSVKTLYTTTFANNPNFTDIYYNGYQADWNKIEIIERNPDIIPNGLITTKSVTVHCLDGDIVLNEPTPSPSPSPSVPTPSAPPKPVGKPREEKIKGFIDRLYLDVLGREPEKEGADYWKDRVSKFDISGAEVAWEFIFSKEFKDKKLNDSQFIDVLYAAFFGREPDPEGKAYWLERLKNGASREQVAWEFIYSLEWANTCAEYGIDSGCPTQPNVEIEPSEEIKAFVTRLYACALDRYPDEEGLKYWSKELANFRLTGEQAALNFFESKEFIDHKVPDQEFVRRLYVTFLDREPDQGGLDYWTGVLAGGDTREHVIRSFTRCEEFVKLCQDSGIKPY